MSSSVSTQEVPQEAYGGRGQSAAMTPGKPNHEELSLSQQERPSSLPVSLRVTETSQCCQFVYLMSKNEIQSRTTFVTQSNINSLLHFLTECDIRLKTIRNDNLVLNKRPPAPTNTSSTTVSFMISVNKNTQFVTRHIRKSTHVMQLVSNWQT